MKVIKKIEFEYVVPESEAEELAIKKTITDSKKELENFNPENWKFIKAPKKS